MFARSILITLFVLFCPAVHAASLLVWGDSLSAGYGLSPGQAWPDLLQTRLQAQGFKKYSVINASISGETTAGGLSRLPAALDRHKPAIVVLELGANDGLRGLPMKQMEDNLQQMIQLAEKSGAKVVLVGMQMPPNFGPAYTRRFAEVYERVARQFQLPFIPFLFEGIALDKNLFQADDLHPTAQAQPRLLDTVWRELAPLLHP